MELARLRALPGPSSPSLDSFAATLNGSIVRPDDKEYDAAPGRP